VIKGAVVITEGHVSKNQSNEDESNKRINTRNNGTKSGHPTLKGTENEEQTQGNVFYIDDENILMNSPNSNIS
jgi:hypothetical protein